VKHSKSHKENRLDSLYKNEDNCYHAMWIY